MSANISKTKSVLNVMVTEPQFPDPLDDIRNLLPRIGEATGCPACCSGEDVWFLLKSEEADRSQVFTPKRLTKLDDTWALAEGANGVVINIGDLAPGTTMTFEPGGTNAFVLMGPEKAMKDQTSVLAAVDLLVKSPQWAEMGKHVNAIGLQAYDRTNDPLIT